MFRSKSIHFFTIQNKDGTFSGTISVALEATAESTTIEVKYPSVDEENWYYQVGFMPIIEDKIKPEDMKRQWHAQQEDILKEWSEQAGCYRWMHERAYQVYKKQNMRFSIPVIVISTVTGTANFAQSGFPESIKGWAPLIIGTLNLAAGLITTIAQFLRVSELLEGHRAASIAYSKLSRKIAVELSLPSDERSMPGIDYIKQCRSDIDRLIEQSPPIPPEILNTFDKNILQDLSLIHI